MVNAIQFATFRMTTSETSSLIYVLDDDPSVLKATSRLLASADWEARAFSDPIAFLNDAGTDKPAVAVIDMMMPVMDGLEVQAKLKGISPNTRVIILTSNDDLKAESTAIDAGAFAFFFKPVDPDVFVASIESALLR